MWPQTYLQGSGIYTDERLKDAIAPKHHTHLPLALGTLFGTDWTKNGGVLVLLEGYVHTAEARMHGAELAVRHLPC